jgi:calcium-translocating P-type ATPase
MPFETSKDDLAKLHDLQVTPETRLRALEGYRGASGLFEVLRSSALNGIFPATCPEREEAFGKNEYAEPDAKSFAELCVEALNDTTMIILCVSAVISLAIGVIKGDGEWYEGFAILMAVVIVTLVTAVNEYKKEQQFQELNKVKGESTTSTVRGGTEQAGVDSGTVVVGDVVKLVMGDKIPADGILFMSSAYSDMQCDESSLTGEAETVKKNPENCPMLYSGCLIAEGQGHMVVTSVGDTSQQGIIRMNLADREEEQTPLQERLEVVAELIGWVGVAVATASFIVLTISWCLESSDGVVKNYHWSELQDGSWKGLLDFLIIAVTIVAVAVPEGLPLAVTISLAYSMFKMMEDQNLVRKLHACETMGSATNICSDKTGTLTQNRMTVVQGYLCGSQFTTDSHGHPSVDNPMMPEALTRLHMCAALNSNASVQMMENGRHNFHGNKTECAILMLSNQLGGNYDRLRGDMNASIIKRNPFNSANKVASVAVKLEKGPEMYMTGAPEMVLDHCTMRDSGKNSQVPLSASDRKQVEDQITGLAKTGLRTVALAYRVLSGDGKQDTEVVEKMVLLGIIGIKDPLRDEVPDAVAACKRAGIFVRMVTGDNVHTATHIAKECGILTGNGIAIEGPEFNKMTDDDIKKRLPHLQVLARSSPNDKFRLVRLLQEMDEVVAVTGDGTNDAPALKKANVGLSMGMAGTQVAMDASDIVIIDDNFASIVQSVKWGRSVFDNIRKFIQFQLTINVVALTISFASAVYCAFYPPNDTATKAFDTEKCTPLNAIQLLWINLIMDSMGALALATEEPGEGLLKRKPIKPEEGMVSPMMWRNIAVQSSFQLLVLAIIFSDASLFGSEAQSRHHYTIIFNVFVWCQIFNEFNSRRLDNTPGCFGKVTESKIFMGVIVATVVVQFLFVQYGGDYTKTVPLKAGEWIRTIGIASLTIPLGYLVRSQQLFVKDEPQENGVKED